MKSTKNLKSKSLLDKIEECDHGGQFELNISGLELSAWPQESVLVPSIRILDAKKNLFTSLPSLDHFRGLVELNLSRNLLTDLVDLRIGSLVGLKKVDISRNALISLPIDIARLQFLEVLCVNRNKLVSLPENMSNLKSLRELDCSYNQLQQVGNVLETLACLEEVNLLHNDSLDVNKLGLRTRRFFEKVCCSLHS